MSLKEISDAQKTPNEAAKTDTFGADLTGFPAGDLKKGFVKESTSQEGDECGNTTVGNHYEREGFLAPGLGYSR